jgi:hypothetical protein
VCRKKWKRRGEKPSALMLSEALALAAVDDVKWKKRTRRAGSAGEGAEGTIKRDYFQL